MNSIKRGGVSMKNKWFTILNNSSREGLEHVASAQFSSLSKKSSPMGEFSKRVMTNSVYRGEAALDLSQMTKGGRQLCGNFILPQDPCRTLASRSPFHTVTRYGDNSRNGYSMRSFASKAREPKRSETRKEISTIEDPFDAPTYNIPEKPVTFTEGASYSLIILAGLGVAGVAAYGVFNELIFQPKEYKIFNKALKRIQDDGQVKVRIGSPITGYGSESRNRAARQRIPHKTWKDEDGVEHIVVNFHIRGPHGAGKVYSEMFKDKEDGQWKFMYLIVDVTSPHPTQLMLESYIPS